ncbi:MAG: hypothetical protein BJ554DRAFT_3776, partial [Olpidium bornovanus]
MPGTPDNMLTVVTSLFNDLPNKPKARKEMCDYIRWTQETFGFTSTRPLVKFYCEALQSAVEQILGEEEVEVPFSAARPGGYQHIIHVVGSAEPQNQVKRPAVLGRFPSAHPNLAVVDLDKLEHRAAAMEILERHGRIDLSNRHIHEKLASIFRQMREMVCPARSADEPEPEPTAAERAGAGAEKARESTNDATAIAVPGEPAVGPERQTSPGAGERHAGPAHGADRPQSPREVMHQFLRQCLYDYAVKMAGGSKKVLGKLKKLDLDGNEKARPASAASLGSETSRPRSARSEDSAGSWRAPAAATPAKAPQERRERTPKAAKKKKQKKEKGGKATPKAAAAAKGAKDAPAETERAADKAGAEPGENLPSEGHIARRPSSADAMDAVVMFCKPKPHDFISSLDHFVKLSMEKEEREAELRRRAIAAETARLERIRLAAEQAALQAGLAARREKEREERARQRAEKLQTQAEQQRAAEKARSVSRNPHIHSHVHEGLTHVSKCHPSRETLAFKIGGFCDPGLTLPLPPLKNRAVRPISARAPADRTRPAPQVEDQGIDHGVSGLQHDDGAVRTDAAHVFDK